jgi:thioredoxin-like negative regulator of GroEL
MQNRFLSFLLGSIFAALAQSVHGADGIAWRSEYASACQEAKRTNRPILIDVGAEWCTWCKKLDATSFRDAEVIKRVTASFVAFRLDADKQEQLIQKFEVSSFPTLLVVNADGRVLGRRNGYVAAPELRSWLDKWATAEPVATAATSSLDSFGTNQPWCRVTILRPTQPSTTPVLSECTEEECRLLEQYVVMAGLLKDQQPSQASEYLQKALAIHSGGHIREEIQARMRELEERATTKIGSGRNP